MHGKFIQKGPRDQSRGKEGRKCYRGEGSIGLLWSDSQIWSFWTTKPGWFFATVLIQEKGPCLHIPYDNLPQWLISRRWEGEEDTMLSEAATSQG